MTDPLSAFSPATRVPMTSGTSWNTEAKFPYLYNSLTCGDAIKIQIYHSKVLEQHDIYKGQ